MFTERCDPTKKCARKINGSLLIYASVLALFIPHIDNWAAVAFATIGGALLGVTTIDLFQGRTK